MTEQAPNPEWCPEVEAFRDKINKVEAVAGRTLEEALLQLLPLRRRRQQQQLLLLLELLLLVLLLLLLLLLIIQKSY